MSNPPTDPWNALWSGIDAFVGALQKSRAVNVNSSSLRDIAKQLVQDYFRKARPELEQLQQPADHIGQLDDLMQRLLALSNGRNSKQSYSQMIKALRKLRPVVESERELRIGKGATGQSNPLNFSSGIEEAIINTLSDLVPSAALSYQQAVRDLMTDNRASMRGTAAELREALREVLDHLAPDRVVMKTDGFKLEKDRNHPTMKQKARFILKSRGVGKTARSSPEAALERVEEGAATLARSAYDRGSVSAHIATSRQEVQQIKLYIDSVLAELLEIHK